MREDSSSSRSASSYMKTETGDGLESSAALPDIPLGGLLPFTTIDFPGRLAAVLFLRGCPWRCLYCSNSELQTFAPKESILSSSQVFAFLQSRKGLLDGVVFSGGEATSFDGLPQWAETARTLGFAVGLHTAGIYPEKLKKVLPYCSWVGLDIKAPFFRYGATTRTANSWEPAQKSMFYILESGVPYEVRTTIHPSLMSEEDLIELARDIAVLGVRHYVLQRFSPKGCSNEELCSAYTADWHPSETLCERIGSLFLTFSIR